MNLDVEARLRRAARVLDRHLEQPATTPTYLAPSPRPARRRPLVASAVAFAAVIALVGAVVAVRVDDSTTLSRTTTGEGWTALPDAPIAARFQHLAVSTGTGLFVWGGYASDDKNDGAFFDSTDGTWRKLPAAPLVDGRGDAVGVWTGREIVVLNGVGPVRAAAFDPIAFTWRALPDPPLANAANAMNKAFFIDGAVIVIGVASEGEGRAPNQVARLDLATSAWTTEASSPVEFSSFFSATRAGDEIVVVAQRPNRKDACGSIILAFRPASSSWREVPAGPAGDRVMPVVAWTGSELFVGGGRLCGTFELSSTADLLDGATNTWRRVSDAPIGFEASGRYEDVWTGHAVATITADGTPVLFDPAANAWHAGGRSRDETTFGDTPFVWVGDALVLWSGGVTDGPTCCDPVEGGVAYRPPPGW